MFRNEIGEIMNEFLKMIINWKDEDLERIVLDRANELENSESTERKIIMPNERIDCYESYYKGFIKKDVKIYNSIGSGDSLCYTLGDYSYLIEFFRYVKNNNINNLNEILKKMSSFVDSYFGIFNGEGKSEQFIYSLGGNITIDKFKGKSLAACSERSAIVNNVLEMLGIKTIYVTGQVNGGQHAFNIILDKNNGYHIFDTTCCCGLYDENNNELGTVSYRYSLGQMSDDLEKFLTEEKEFKLPDAICRMQKDGSLKYEENGRIKKYIIEPILLEDKKRKIH